MTELEKIAYAKCFLDKLADGISPLDDTPISSDDIVNNPRLSKCFSYVADILGQVVANGKKTEARSKKMKRVRFHITAEQLVDFQYSEVPITTGEFCRRLEMLVDLSKMKHFSRSRLPLWLVHMGLLHPPKEGERGYAGEPTEEGLKIGITQITYQDKYGVRTKNAFTLKAQQFLIDNKDAFLAFGARKGLKA